jgi:hypothetical protein
MLGDDFSGVLIVDGLASYDVLECVKGRCVGHILRRARGLTEGSSLPKSDREHVETLITLLKTALATAAHRDDWPSPPTTANARASNGISTSG